MLHFAARSVMNIDGMGESLVNQLVENKIVRSVADLYDLTAEQANGTRTHGTQVG